MKKLAVFLIFFGFTTIAFTQSEAETLISEAIKFHDPTSQWQSLKAEIDITSFVEQEGKRDTSSRTLFFDLAKGEFEMRQDSIVYKVPCEDCERAKMYNNYFRYLLGMPMKLMDTGTIISKDISLREYKRKKYRVVTVNYEPEVGTYTWLFYFAMDRPELILTEFSKDGTFQNGETIELNNKVKFQNMLLPGQLKWFVLPDRPFLAEENIKYKEINNK
jgi:hypothetical protein